ncbi:MAG: HEAT repeat domain-containing protein [Candidatus Odinarchaeota archaeon]
MEDKGLEVDELLEQLNSGDWKVRQRAAEALGQLGHPRSIDPLINSLKDEVDSRVRFSAAQSLGKFGGPAVDPLIKTLRDNHDNDNIRYLAAWALGEIGDSRAIKPLIKMLETVDYEVRYYAAWILGVSGDSSSVKPLVEVLNDENAHVRQEAAIAIRAITARNSNTFSIIISVIHNRGPELTTYQLTECLKLLVDSNVTGEQLLPLKTFLMSYLLTGNNEDVNKQAKELLTRISGSF